MDIKFKKVISLLLCCVLLFGMLPVNAFATNENAMDSSAVENNATEEQPQESTSVEEPAEPDVPSTEESTEAPVVEETPAEKLYKQLMAFETYEALRAFLDNMTAEQLEVMNQFSYEQTAALSERMKALQGDIAAPVSEDTGNDEGDSEEITGEDTVIPDEIQVVEKTGSDDAVNAQVPAEGQTVDVDALFTRLMAAATYEELDALMEDMTEEEYALMAQFSDEQNGALAARVNFLSEYDSGVLADLTIAQGDTGTHTITAGRWDYDCRVYRNNANVTNSAGITVSDNGGTVTISVSETTAPGDYEVKYGYSWNGFNEIGNFTFTVVTAPSGSGTTTGPAEEIKRMTYDKKAVANGDGTYELSLSVSGSVGSSTSKALVDVIFIVDNSNSMYESSAYMSKLKPAMKSLVNNISNTNGDKIDARYAIAMFGTNSEIRQNFANDATTRNSIDGIGSYSYYSGGTNYQAGIYQGKQLLNSRRDGATTVVVFVTDGLPTYRGAPNMTDGSGNGDRGNYNISAAVSEISGMSCNYFYCIGIGKDFTDSSTTANQNMTKLTSAVNAGTTGIYAVSQGTASELEAVFNKITAQVSTFLCSNVTITDRLSQVDSELMVQITNPASVKITVQAGDETYGPAASVKLPATEYNKTETTLTAQYNSDSSTLTLAFPEGYMLEPDYTYIISATIEPTEKAYEEYRKTGYTDVGGANTGTHSGQAGFFANESATITYTYSDGVETKTETKTYPQPVIQLEPGTLVINKKIVGLAAEQYPALTFPVTLTVPGKTAETQEIPFEWFAEADEDGIYTFTMGGLYPNTAYSVTESGYELEHYNVATNVTGADQNEGIVASGTVAKNATDTVTFTNTYTLAVTDVPVSKIWTDADNQDGKRPASITINLMNGDAQVASKTVTEADGWAWTFKNVDKYDANGKVIAYTVTENAVDGYTTAITGSQAEGFVITNTHTPAVTSVRGAKTWQDNDNQDGKRPASITISLLANGQTVATKTVAAADNWAWTFENLPEYAGGQKINYTIAEMTVDGYQTSINGYNVTNTHIPEKTEVRVSKAWNDADDQDGFRPESISVVLLANGTETGKTLVLSESNNWTGSFTALDKFANGKEVAYTVKEIAVANYETSIAGSQSDGYTVTNSHTPEVVEVSGSKTWNDNNNQDGARPASITINLLQNGNVIDTKTVTEADGWAWSFTNLPKYENGTLINYSVTETAVEGYTTTYNGYNVTNTHAPAKTSVTVTKAWSDNNDQDGIRPNDVTINLLANGTETGKTLVLSEGNNWTGSFTELDKFAAGKEVAYTIEEVTVSGYATVITGSQSAGYTVTNSHTPEVVEVSGSKTWVDNDNQDGVRPESITINLQANGKVIDSKVVTAADGWEWSFTNLPKYENKGNPISYSITENTVEDYTVSYNGYDVTNTHAPAKTSVTVTKAWSDNNDQDGIRPNDVTIKLLANSAETGKTLVLSEGNNWTGSFTELDKFAAGKEVVYTIEEVTVSGYATVITGSQSAGYTVTNSHTPEVVEVSGSKTWNDNNNQDGARPESITINLQANGTVIDSKVVTAADGWAWSFTNLPKYENKGNPISYSITENTVEDYTVSYNGYDVTNTHAPAKTSVTVTKAWSDNNDQDGIRPNDVTIKLLANGTETGKTLVLSEGNNWTGSFTELDKFAAGKEVVYTIEEVAVEGYESVLTGDQNTGYTVTNSHNPETFGIEGAKTWDDKDNQDGKRPESITIRLLADGVEKEHVTVTEENEWSWSFTNLPKYRDHGVEILYTITEDAVDDYNTIIDGFNVTNKYTPQETSITVTKSWQDNNNQDGIRPKKITVNLLKNGKPFKSQDIVADDNWTYTFSKLDVYAKGEKIEYTIEEKAVDGYETVVTGNAVTGFTVTNSHTPAVVDLSGTKTWDDDNNRDGKRPDSITVRLKANGKEVAVATVTAEDKWSYEFTNLPEYEAGKKIVYTVTEDAVAEYTVQYNEKNLDITNKYTPGKTFVTVTKRWVDGQNHDGIRPGSVTVELYANGVKIDSMKLTAKNDWVGVFDGLYIYENGKAIEYTVEEKPVWGYNSTVTGSADKGYTVTNTHNIIPKTGDDSNLPLYTGLFGASFTAMAVLMFLAKPRKKGKYLR